MPDINIIKIEGKPLEKLIETVRAAIGTLYKPRAIRNEADAEAYKIEKLDEAKAKGLILNANVEFEILDRAKERFINQELHRQINIENIAEKTAKYLNESVSEQPVDNDWRTKFFNKSQDISNDEMQEIWARILAEEVNMPGKTSLRTLEIVSNLTKKEAEIFQRAAGLTFQGSHILKITNANSFDEFGITYDNLLTLRAANLIFDSDWLTLTIDHFEQVNGAILIFGKKAFKIRKVNVLKHVFNQVAFTPAGSELIRTLKFEPNYSYLEKFIDVKTKEGYVFENLHGQPLDINEATPIQ